MSNRAKIAVYLAWGMTLLSVFGSFYFNFVKGYAPCTLCWYQRGFMIALLIIVSIGIWTRDQRLGRYALPLSLIGLLVAAYHNLLYYGVIPERLATCVNGVSCATRYINYFGFVSVPLLSLIAFTVITICLVVYGKTQATS